MKTHKKLTRLRNKCDRALQEEGKIRYKKCEVCGKPINCLHHFHPKSTSSALRYDWDNLIPICQGCHMRHHQAGDPLIHGAIIKKRGMAWYNRLEKKRRTLIKVNLSYYEEVLCQLQKAI